MLGTIVNQAAHLAAIAQRQKRCARIYEYAEELRDFAGSLTGNNWAIRRDRDEALAEACGYQRDAALLSAVVRREMGIE